MVQLSEWILKKLFVLWHVKTMSIFVVHSTTNKLYLLRYLRKWNIWLPIQQINISKLGRFKLGGGVKQKHYKLLVEFTESHISKYNRPISGMYWYKKSAA